MEGQKMADKNFSPGLKDASPEDYRYLVGEYLYKAGQITRRQLDEASAHVKINGGFISSYLLGQGYIEANTVPALLSRKYSYWVFNIAERQIGPGLLEMLPYDLAREYGAFPVQFKNGVLSLAMLEPVNPPAISELQSRLTGVKSIAAGVMSEPDLFEGYRRYYKVIEEEFVDFSQEEEDFFGTVDDLGDLIADVVEDFEVLEEPDEGPQQFQASDAPIIKLVNQIILKAVTEGISDIHIEPFERQFFVRYRRDGVLYKSMKLPLEIKKALISRFKIMASLDITARNVPQDGRIKMKIGRRRELELEVSTLPTLFGESVVLHLRDKGALTLEPDRLGFSQRDLSVFMKAVDRPRGLVLVAGPRDSGKTTTLYSALTRRNTDDVKILAAEEKIGFHFAGINQVPVVRPVGMTHAKALKSFLLQDPDICMIGEIRNLETAEVAIEAANSGILMFSTLAVKDSVSALARLLNMGISGFDLAASLNLVIAQRLLRRLCPACKTQVKNVGGNLLEAGVRPEEFEARTLFQPKGCIRCSGTGYKGRLGCFELLERGPGLTDALSRGASEEELRRIALENGLVSLRRAALNAAGQGLTSLEEVLEKTMPTADPRLEILRSAREISLEGGGIIIRENSRDSHFYELIRGCLAVYKGKNKVGEISEPGTYFGELSSLLGERRTATVRSIGPSMVRVYEGRSILELIESDPAAAPKVLRRMGRSLSDGYRRISELTDEKRELEQRLNNLESKDI